MRKTKTPSVVYGLGQGEAAFQEQLAKSMVEIRVGKDEEKPSLTKSILNILGSNNEIARLAFETDPTQVNNFAGVYHAKLRLVPDSVLKRIAIQDSLVASIVRARQNHLTSFGRPRPDRYSCGFIVKPNTGTLDKLDAEGKKKFAEQVERAIKLLSTCGHTEDQPDEHQRTFSEYLGLSARSAVVCGRIATEIVYSQDSPGGEKKFHHFACTDSGTIYRATTDKTGQDSIRKEAYHLLCKLVGEKLTQEKWNNNEYSWVQVIDGTPKQVFTSEEMKVYNFYPVPDVELNGYPVTPIDTVITAITTHINITTHNKLYFQSGRAARGMLVVKSDDVSPQMIHQIKQQFNASINSASNSWRMPCFGIPTDGEISWQPIDTGGGRDMEFQYLTDMNVREILTAFMMSPDELPGWSYLSRGTASQALSECIASESRILTSTGLVSIGQFVGKNKEREGVIWSGKEWVRGRAFRSGIKDLVETELGCGVVLRTSPDHRFRVVDDNGELVWKHQSELKVNDRVLVNKKPIEGSDSLVPSYKGKKLTPEVVEILGWMTGDGCVRPPRVRAGAQIHLFYHHEKERDVWESQNKVLTEFGVNVVHKQIEVSEEKQEEVRARYGFKKVANVRLRNTIYDTDFYRFLEEVGFTPSSSGKDSKTVPSLLYALPVEYRAAFLRGLFSADGGKINKTGSVALTIQNDKLRDQVRQLLLTLGIRALPCKGTAKPKNCLLGQSDVSYKLFVKDRAAFWSLVGFIQPHKQLDKHTMKWNIDRPSWGVIKSCLEPCQKSSLFRKLPKSRRDMINAILNGKACSYNSLAALMAMCEVVPPFWFVDYNIEAVSDIRNLNQRVEMYDVEMYDDVHAFAVEGVITHNSNNQYKLEAARDVGIRPLLASFEDFINAELFPLIDADLASKAKVSLVGLDADTPEKEATQLQTTAEVYLNFDDILQKVEKDPVGKEMGGQIPLNPVYQELLDKYFTVGQILEKFCGMKDASKDPSLNYRRDQFWFTQVQLLQAQQQAEAQEQQAQQGGPQGDGGGGGQPGGGQQSPDGSGEGQEGPSRQNPQDDQTEKQRTASTSQSPQTPAPKATELGKAIEQAYELMQKSEDNLPVEKKKILAQHKKIVDFFVRGFEKDTKEATSEILDIARQLSPRGK
jgi:hypothetical protein